MIRRVGDQQLELLITMGCPATVLVTSDAGVRRMVERGLLTEGPGCRITSTGLRALADAMDAGRVDAALERMRQRLAAKSPAGRQALGGTRDG